MTTKTKRVASRSPGTCSESLWLLPSGPDQVHDAAMRGDPPLIGCACGADCGLSSIGVVAASKRRIVGAPVRSVRRGRRRVCRYNRRFRRSPCRCRQRRSIEIASFAPLPPAPGGRLPSRRASRCCRSFAVPHPCPRPEEARELVVLIRPGPAFYFPGPGWRAGRIRRRPRAAVRRREEASAQVCAGGFRRRGDRRHRQRRGAHRRRRSLPAAGGGRGENVGCDSGHHRARRAQAAPEVLWTTGVASAEPVLIYNRDGFKPANWGDLDGATVAFVPDAGFDYEIAVARAAHPGIEWDRSPCRRWRDSSRRFPTARSATRS